MARPQIRWLQNGWERFLSLSLWHHGLYWRLKATKCEKSPPQRRHGSVFFRVIVNRRHLSSRHAGWKHFWLLVSEPQSRRDKLQSIPNQLHWTSLSSLSSQVTDFGSVSSKKYFFSCYVNIVAVSGAHRVGSYTNQSGKVLIKTVAAALSVHTFGKCYLLALRAMSIQWQDKYKCSLHSPWMCWKQHNLTDSGPRHGTHCLSKFPAPFIIILTAICKINQHLSICSRSEYIQLNCDTKTVTHGH